jgi:2-polyprenyl-3-methyl-5-hydroxy-6-metoxy-1,4-benzoquinol methylase
VRNLEAYQEAYASLPFEDTQLRYRKRKILESLTKYQARSILEVGCGRDPLFNYYSEFESFTVVEPGHSFVKRAQALGEGITGVTVVAGTLEDRAELLRERSYDFIVLSSLLHEVPDSVGLLETTKGLCKLNTIVHVNVPNACSFHRLLALEMGIIQNVYERSATQVQMQQSHSFDLDSLASLVSGTGFRIMEQGTFFIKPFAHSQMASLQSAGILTDQILDGFYALTKHFPKHGSEIFMNLILDA